MFLIVLLVFFAGVIVGFYTSPELQRMLTESFFEKVEGLSSDHSGILAVNIFLNNLFVCFLLVMLFFTFLLPPLIIFANGVIIGIFLLLISRISELHNLSSSSLIFASLLPHGIFELSAVFLSAAIGINLGVKLLFRCRYKPHFSFTSFFKFCIRSFVLLVIPLLFLAALAEVYVTPFVSSFSVNESLKNTPSEALHAISLSADEIGGQEISEVLFSDATQRNINRLTTKSALLLIYSDEDFEILKKAFPTATKHLYFSRDGAYLGIIMSEHSGSESADLYAGLIDKLSVFHEKSAADNKMELTRLHILDDNIFVLMFSNDEELLNKTFELQKQKIAQVSGSK